MKIRLPKQLKMMLNALEAQHFKELGSDEYKRNALDTLMAKAGDGQEQALFPQPVARPALRLVYVRP